MSLRRLHAPTPTPSNAAGGSSRSSSSDPIASTRAPNAALSSEQQQQQSLSPHNQCDPQKDGCCPHTATTTTHHHPLGSSPPTQKKLSLRQRRRGTKRPFSLIWCTSSAGSWKFAAAARLSSCLGVALVVWLSISILNSRRPKPVWFQQQRLLERDSPTAPTARKPPKRSENPSVAARWHIYNSNNNSTTSLVRKRTGDVAMMREKEDVSISPLSAVDYSQFTVRINTWRRPEQLQLSVNHYLTCRSVAQVQVVWCVDQGEVAPWLQALEQTNSRVWVERHVINSLNARFNIQPSFDNNTRNISATPTAGILSTDDDVIRPCMALESTFLLWTRNPDRQVGFDARSHGILATTGGNQKRWTYAYMSTTERSNQYSLTLTRQSFQHRDYLESYTHRMPIAIRNRVAQHLNCEDVAMSLWISSLTQGLPPLLADFWAVKSQIKLFVEHKISGGNSHKSIRDDCVNDFADLLQLKDRLKLSPLRRHGNSFFEYGSTASNWNSDEALKYHEQRLEESTSASWYTDVQNTLTRWKETNHVDQWQSELALLRSHAARPMYDLGWIESTAPWRKRFRPMEQE